MRVPVQIAVERVLTWPDLRCSGAPPSAAPRSPASPRRTRRRPGTGPARAWTSPAWLAGWPARGTRCSAGPGRTASRVVAPVAVERDGDAALRLIASAPLPPGRRRAGLLGHSYRPRLVGLETHQCTGWLEVGPDGAGRYAPHTETGYRAPPNKHLLLLLNGALAKRGVRAARRAGSG